MIDARRIVEIRERLASLANLPRLVGKLRHLDEVINTDLPALLDELEKLNDLHDPPTVMLETPYAGDVEANEDYARRCMLHALRRGEAPMAGHLLYTQVLKDANPTERELGIRAHLAWLRRSRGVVLYTDRGVSKGMQQAIELGMTLDVPIEQRTLDGYNGGN